MNDTVISGLEAHARIALYYAPPRTSAWWHAGSEWLGRDAETNEALTSPAAAETNTPRRYGWHGTLVAPFRCGDGVFPRDVLAVSRKWALGQMAFDLAVKAEIMGRFVALRAAVPSDDTRIRGIASSALTALAPLRARATAQALERRITPTMTPRQIALLREWDYPYVHDEFRFHMTLSNSLDSANARSAIAAQWTPRIDKLGALPFHGAALFVEREPGAPFMLWKRLSFAQGEAA